MRYKGLTNYPVLVLTIISLLAISYLSLSIMDKIYELKEYDLRRKDVSKINYVIIQNRLFLEIQPSIYDNIDEIVIYSNGTTILYHLNKIDRRYGPIIVSRDIDKIILIGYYNDNPTLLDILIVRKVDKTIDFNINRYLPPSLEINFVDTGYILINSINKKYVFYVLKPVEYEKQFLLNKNQTYIIDNDDIIVNTGVYKDKFLINKTFLSHYIEFEKRLENLLNYYGEVIEYRNYTLLIYEDKDFVLNPRFKSISEEITSYPENIVVSFPIEQLVIDDNVLVKIRINCSISQIELRDIYGNTYIAYVELKTWLYIYDTMYQLVEKIYLGNVSSYTGQLQGLEISFSNYTYMDQGEYIAELVFNYTVYPLNVIRPNTYFILTKQVYGGFNNYIYLKTYTYNELIISLQNNTIRYRPVENMSVINISIHGISGFSLTKYIINEEFIVEQYNITYTGSEEVFVEDYVKPCSLIYVPVFIELYSSSDNIKLYRIMEFQNHTILYGIYILNNTASIMIKYNPVIILEDRYIVFNQSNYNIYILNIPGETQIVWKRDSMFVENISAIYGFIVYKEVSYEYPILLLNNVLGINISITIEYIDGEIIGYEHIWSQEIYCLENKIIKEINITLYNYLNGEILSSIFNNSLFFVNEGKSCYKISSIEEISVFSEKLYKIYLDNGEVIYVKNQ